MYHPRLKGSHYQMGCTMGRIFQKSGARFPIRLDRFQQELGQESAALLEKHFPGAVDEIRGITDTIGLEYRRFAAWMMCMGCCLDPAEHGAESYNRDILRGCTAFAFVREGRNYYGRNNDLPPFMRAFSKSILYRPEGSPGFLLNTSSFINGEEGLNLSGLVVAMTFVVPRPAEIQPGLNSVFLVRYLLEHCTTVPEALQSLRRLPIASACNILLADAAGNMVVAECCPTEVHVRTPETSRRGEPFIVTVNAFTSEQMRPHDGAPADMFYSRARFTTADNALRKAAVHQPVKQVAALLSGGCGFMCSYPRALNFDTIWSSIFDLSALHVLRAEGNPQRARYREDPRLAAGS